MSHFPCVATLHIDSNDLYIIIIKTTDALQELHSFAHIGNIISSLRAITNRFPFQLIVLITVIM